MKRARAQRQTGVPVLEYNCWKEVFQLRLFGTLRSRIFGALFAISLVPIAVLVIQGYHCSMEAVTELAQKHLLAVADARKSEVETWLHERAKSIETLAAVPLLADKAAAAATLAAFQAKNPSFVTVALSDHEGALAAAAGSAADANIQLPDDATVSATVLATEPETTAQPVLRFRYPVKNEQGDLTGFLTANLDFAITLTTLLQDREGLYETGKVFLVGHDGAVLTQPLPDERLATWSRSTSSQAHHMPAVAQEVGSYTDYRGHQVLGAVLPVGAAGWQLVAEVDRDEAMGWLSKLLVRAAATGLVTCLVVVGIAAWISSLVGKPLRELVRIALRIRAGHTEERLDRMNVTEAEEVRQAFNAMLDELREKQDELVKAATLAYVGELTSSTVHEMRNPLSSIKMNLQALSRSLDPSSRYKELGQIALDQAARLEQMLTDLLNFGKPLKLNPAPLQFGELAEATIEVTAEAAQQNGVSINVTSDLNGSLLFVDKEQMCRAAANLVRNAIEAMPEGGTVTISACQDNGEIQVAVQDTGPGLPDEAMHRALQPFYTTKPNGTGLGLPNVKKIVDLHGGRLVIENGPGGGACFKILLPSKCIATAEVKDAHPHN